MTISWSAICYFFVDKSAIFVLIKNFYSLGFHHTMPETTPRCLTIRSVCDKVHSMWRHAAVCIIERHVSGFVVPHSVLGSWLFRDKVRLKICGVTWRKVRLWLSLMLWWEEHFHMLWIQPTVPLKLDVLGKVIYGLLFLDNLKWKRTVLWFYVSFSLGLTAAIRSNRAWFSSANFPLRSSFLIHYNLIVDRILLAVIADWICSGWSRGHDVWLVTTLEVWLRMTKELWQISARS